MVEVNVQPEYERISLHLKDGVMVSKWGTRYKKLQVNWYFDNRMTLEGVCEGSEDWVAIK